jgi:activating signal cointegrator complex subunit 2
MSTIAPPRPTNALPTSVPYLPRDDHGGGSSQFDPISAAVVASLDANLGALLRMECGEFWRHIAHDVSIARALDTYLRYRRRPYDDGAVCAVAPPTTTNDDDDDAHEDLDDRLARRVFMTIRRLATIERDDPLVPTLASRATALTKLRLVDAAKILDVCALFGPDNPRATAELVADLIAMFGEPLLDDLAAAGAAAAVDMDARADALIEDMFADDGLDPSTRDDALGYFRDVGATLTELIRAAPAIADRLDEGREVSDKCRTTQETSRTFGEMTIHECGSGGAGVGGKGDDVAVAPGALAAAIDRVVHETAPTLEQAALSFSNDESGTSDAESSRVRVKCAAATSALTTLLRVMRDPPVECGVPGGVPGAAAGVSGSGGESFDGDEKEKELVLATEKIEALRGLLPDHGDGYLAAVLDAFDGNPETAAGHVFEGSLPLHLQKMDTRTTLEAYFSKKKKTAPAPVSADGKAAALKGTWATRAPVRPNAPQSAAAGGFIRRKGDNRDRAGNRTWDLRVDSADQKTTLALASALEYDDEYDDSFDELAEVKGLGSAAGEVSEGIPMVPGSNPRGGATTKEKTGGPPNKSYWISDGKVYHSRKDGATKVQASSNEEAAAIAARMSAVEKDRVHGLGAGGNRAAFDAGAAPFVPGGGGRGGNGGRGGGGGGGAGGDRGPPPPSTGGRHNRGGGAADHQRKKHFRKDAAAKKMSKGMGPPQ